MGGRETSVVLSIIKTNKIKQKLGMTKWIMVYQCNCLFEMLKSNEVNLYVWHWKDASHDIEWGEKAKCKITGIISHTFYNSQKLGTVQVPTIRMDELVYHVMMHSNENYWTTAIHHNTNESHKWMLHKSSHGSKNMCWMTLFTGKFDLCS